MIEAPHLGPDKNLVKIIIDTIRNVYTTRDMKIKHKYILAEVFRRIGSQSELARMLGVSRQYVSAWDKVPLTHVNAISKATKIPKKVLRPDLYD